MDQQAKSLEVQSVELTFPSGWRRSHDCGSLRLDHSGQNVVLMGWVQRRRDHGGLIFVDLRDREGITQIVFDPQADAAAHEAAHALRSEYVIAVQGTVRQRPEGMANPKLKTGDIEVLVYALKILNVAKTPPFLIEDDTEVSESVRLKYRYLDLRRPVMQAHLRLRHRAAFLTRNYFAERGFIEVETPVLTKSTPEGARDYLVPSRVNPGKFYALPQSPQLFKQLLMVAGLERYMQIVKCFRDEDLRADRQPEFTQLDLEMSFIEEEDIYELIEGWLSILFKDLLGLELSTPFLRLSYRDALNRYGTDRPDLRFGLELTDLTDLVKGCDFRVFREAVERGGLVKSLRLADGARLSRKDLDDLVHYAQEFGAKGMAWAKLQPDGWQSPIAKFLDPSLRDAIVDRMQGRPGDILFFMADHPTVVHETLGNVRTRLAQQLDLIPKGQYRFCWITHFPLLEWNPDEKRYVAVHHPFTSPLEEDMDFLESDPLKVRSRAYDLVLNGTEIGGGSIRIHREDVQKKIFGVLGIGDQEARDKFGFLLDALQYGAPPHGGIAFGFDRLIMLMTGATSIRDVIAFPKTQKATCLMSGAPSEPDVNQLLELCIRVDKEGR
ncbi:aspartyl-tRNA synthetase [Desulfosoma caldarium]|uniref:Aspartate--tRNA(Asp/Asn) ligase n=1 Tax=Desulfosoma caldarium TaxID=610254 RepID=A0A3N1UQ54_9BACT|nr:aspartyl-tRNA synthetase [Desulfosoma caldarium]